MRTGQIVNPDERNPYDRRFHRPLQWNTDVTVLMEHRLFRRLPEFNTWTREQHAREARYALGTALALENTYFLLVRTAEETYGNQGPLISGIVRDHFPDEVKHTFRELVRRVSREFDRSIVHWHAAGKQIHTWRAMRDRLRAVLEERTA